MHYKKIIIFSLCTREQEMSEIILITGGTRSGKSRFALEKGESLGRKRAFIATCPLCDNEMIQRIDRHKKERALRGWDTFEEEIDLKKVAGGAEGYQVLLIECITLWISNWLYRYEASGSFEQAENRIEQELDSLLNVLEDKDYHTLFVSNEVGMGIVPDNPLARLFRDISGRCNQRIASRASEVVLLSCGLPLWLKKNNQSGFFSQ